MRPDRQEAQVLWQLAWPMMVGQLAQTGMGFVDAVMAGQVGAVDLAAIALGSAVWLPLYLFMSGVVLALTPRVAQALGSGQYGVVQHALGQMLWLVGVMGVMSVVFLVLSPVWLLWFSLDSGVRDEAAAYLHGLAYGVVPALLYQALRFFHEGHGQTRVTMWLAVAGFLLNIPLNALFVYGWGSLEGMGGAGCGYATALTFVLMLLGNGIYWWRHTGYLHYRVNWRWQAPDVLEWQRQLRVGLPIAAAILFEVGLFTFIAFLVTPLGTVTLAAHQIAISYTSLIFMVPLSLAMALTVRVGHLTGAGDLEGRQVAVSTALVMAVLQGGLVAVLTAWGSVTIAELYTQDVAVATLAAGLMWYAALYQVSDAIQVTCAGALRGIEDTAAVMWITLLAYWVVGLPSGYVLCYGWEGWIMPMGVAGYWLSFVLGLSLAAMGLAIRVWRRMYRLRA